MVSWLPSRDPLPTMATWSVVGCLPNQFVPYLHPQLPLAVYHFSIFARGKTLYRRKSTWRSGENLEGVRGVRVGVVQGGVTVDPSAHTARALPHRRLQPPHPPDVSRFSTRLFSYREFSLAQKS